MNTPPLKKIFDASVVQDKYAPGRVDSGSAQPVPPETPARPQESHPSDTHHGSRTRQTKQIAGWVLPPLKERIQAMAKNQGLSESKVVAALVEKALQVDADLQYGALLKPVIQQTIKQELQSENNRTANLALEAFYSAEEARILVIHLLRLLLGEDIDVLPQIIKQSQEQARENLSRALSVSAEHN